MILRFKATDDSGRAHYLALNTDTQAYTQGTAAMPEGFTPVEISTVAYSYILRELDFNAWSCTDDILTAPDLSEVPAF